MTLNGKLTLRGQLIQLLDLLEARVEVLKPRANAEDLEFVGKFALVLGYRRKAIKPVERLSARIEWAKLALSILDKAEEVKRCSTDQPSSPPRRVSRGR